MTQKISPIDTLNPKMQTQIGPEQDIFTNNGGYKLHCSYWYPNPGVKPRGLVFLCHGFGEHLQWYEELAIAITNVGCIAFGHDHVGHGRSEGMQGHIEKAENYSSDVLDHFDKLRKSYPELPRFIVGHSMGGMIAIRCAMSRPDYFTGVVLMGPLIKPAPQATKAKMFFAQWVSKVLPYVSVAKISLDDVTRDQDIIERLKKDPLRYHGGVRCHWAVQVQNVLDYFEDKMDDVTWPFYILHGEMDNLCSTTGSKELYKRAKSTDKKIKIFENAKHHLYLELPEVRKEAINDTVNWIDSHILDRIKT